MVQLCWYRSTTSTVPNSSNILWSISTFISPKNECPVWHFQNLSNQFLSERICRAEVLKLFLPCLFSHGLHRDSWVFLLVDTSACNAAWLAIFSVSDSGPLFNIGPAGPATWKLSFPFMWKLILLIVFQYPIQKFQRLHSWSIIYNNMLFHFSSSKDYQYPILTDNI